MAPLGLWKVLACWTTMTISAGLGLTCYDCTLLETEDGLFRKETGAYCKNPDTLHTKTTICPVGSYKCGYINAEVTDDLLPYGSSTFRFVSRQCMRSYANNCEKDVTTIKEYFRKLMKLGSYPFSVDGEVCYCSTSRCTAPELNEDTADLWYVWLLVGGGVLIVLCLVIVCCCCKRAKFKGRVIAVNTVPAVATSQPVAVVSTQPALITGNQVTQMTIVTRNRFAQATVITNNPVPQTTIISNPVQQTTAVSTNYAPQTTVCTSNPVVD